MGTHAVERAHRLRLHVPAVARTQLAWLAGGLAVGFLVPFVFADTLQLPRDLYYAVHIVAVVAFVALWARRTGQDLPALARRRVPLTLALGLAAAGVLALVVLRTEDATARPDGLELVAAVLWRGVAYGAADGLLLSVFPILAVFALFAGTRARRGVAGTVAVGLAALAASLAMTAVYHLGYAEFRDADLAKPVGGNPAWSLPTVVTASPIASPIAHAALHVTAVVESYETDVFLPPHE